MNPSPSDFGEALALHGYAGVYNSNETFLGTPRIHLEDAAAIREADVVLLGAPFDGGTSYRPGARFGPQAIRRADYLPLVPYRPHLALRLDPFSELRIRDAGDVPMPPGDLEAGSRLLQQAVATVARSGAIPLVLGGDHSIALPNLHGVAQALGSRSFGVIQLDAHCDLGDANDFGGPYGHGTSMRRAIEDGAIRGDAFLQFGLRGYWPGPATIRWAEERGIRWIDMSRIARQGVRASLEEVLAATRAWEAVYLSIDIDVVDPGMAPGTGTPEPGGLSGRELLEVARTLATELPLVGAELVEVSPPYDVAGGITALLGNRVVLEVLSGLAARRKGRAGVLEER